MSILVCYDSLQGSPDKIIEAEYLDLRMSKSNEIELMEVYESIHPEWIQKLRSIIQEFDPSLIIVVGESNDYKWLATVVARTFGQFNSWHHQWDKDYGKTQLKVNDKLIEVYAIKKIEDWSIINEGTY